MSVFYNVDELKFDRIVFDKNTLDGDDLTSIINTTRPIKGTENWYRASVDFRKNPNLKLDFSEDGTITIYQNGEIIQKDVKLGYYEDVDKQNNIKTLNSRQELVAKLVKKVDTSLKELTTTLKQTTFDAYSVDKEVVESEPIADPFTLDQDSEVLLIEIMLKVLKEWEDKFPNSMSLKLLHKKESAQRKVIKLTDVEQQDMSEPFLEKETKLPIQTMMLPPEKSKPKPKPAKIKPIVNPIFTVGDEIEARWMRGSHYYPGKITDVNSDGTYTIQYDDDEIENNVPEDLIKKVDNKLENKRILRERMKNKAKRITSPRTTEISRVRFKDNIRPCDGDNCDNENATWCKTIREIDKSQGDKRHRILAFCSRKCAKTRDEDLYLYED
jgi:hypothetical protein